VSVGGAFQVIRNLLRYLTVRSWRSRRCAFRGISGRVRDCHRLRFPEHEANQKHYHRGAVWL